MGKGHGTLAVLGHVDRTWSRSFGSGYGQGQAHMRSFIEMLRQGYPVGSAMDYMNEHYAELSTELTHLRDAARRSSRSGSRAVTRSGEPAEVDVDPNELFGLWREHNDARNFVILGDPAVRLATHYPLAGLADAAAGEKAEVLRQPSWADRTSTKKELIEALLKLDPADRKWVWNELRRGD